MSKREMSKEKISKLEKYRKVMSLIYNDCKRVRVRDDGLINVMEYLDGLSFPVAKRKK
jgi:hypothetical protein